MSKAKTDGIKLIANNKKARHDYFVEDSFEAGIVLHGTEVKSLRQGHCSIKESFVDIDNGEVFIHQMPSAFSTPCFRIKRARFRDNFHSLTNLSKTKR